MYIQIKFLETPCTTYGDCTKPGRVCSNLPNRYYCRCQQGYCVKGDNILNNTKKCYSIFRGMCWFGWYSWYGLLRLCSFKHDCIPPLLHRWNVYIYYNLSLKLYMGQRIVWNFQRDKQYYLGITKLNLGIGYNQGKSLLMKVNSQSQNFSVYFMF